MKDHPDPKDFVACLAPALHSAAGLARDLEGRVANRPKAGEASPVKAALTAADMAVQETLLVALHAELPGVVLEAEEDTPTAARFAKEGSAVVVVDPIDGTREYVEGVPDFALSIALSVGGEPALAVLLNPARDDLFTSIRGDGAWRNGERISATVRNEVDGATLLASRTETQRGEFEPFKARMGVREVGSTA